MQHKDAVRFSVFLTISLLLSLVAGGIGDILCTIVISYYFVIGGFAFIISGLLSVLSFNFVLSFDLVGAIIQCMGIVLPAFFIGIGLLRRRSFKFILLTGTAASFFLRILEIVNQTAKTGKSTFELMFGDSVKALRDMIEGGNFPIPIEFSSEFFNMMEYIIPSFLVLSSLLLTYVVFGVVRKLLRRRGIKFENLPKFYNLRIGKEAVYVLIILFLITLLFGPSPGSLNILIIMSAVLMVCGVSVIDYYLRRYKVHGIYRTIIYIIGFFLSALQGVAFILLGIGIVDSFRELRR